MARLLTPERGKESSSMDEGPGGTKKGGKETMPARRLSFKVRGGAANTGTSRPLRATKLTLPSTSVAAIASKFNAVVVDDNAQTRVLIKKLSHPKKPQKPSTEVLGRPGLVMGKSKEGTVQEAIQRFELRDPDTKKKHPKFVLVRKNSSLVKESRQQRKVEHAKLMRVNTNHKVEEQEVLSDCFKTSEVGRNVDAQDDTRIVKTGCGEDFYKQKNRTIQTIREGVAVGELDGSANGMCDFRRVEGQQRLGEGNSLKQIERLSQENGLHEVESVRRRLKSVGRKNSLTGSRCEVVSADGGLPADVVLGSQSEVVGDGHLPNSQDCKESGIKDRIKCFNNGKAILKKENSNSKFMTREVPSKVPSDVVAKAKPKLQPKPNVTSIDKKFLSNGVGMTSVKEETTNFRNSVGDLKENRNSVMPMKVNRLSIPKNSILESVLNESRLEMREEQKVEQEMEIDKKEAYNGDKKVIRPNTSFLWGANSKTSTEEENIAENPNQAGNIKPDGKLNTKVIIKDEKFSTEKNNLFNSINASMSDPKQSPLLSQNNELNLPAENKKEIKNLPGDTLKGKVSNKHSSVLYGKIDSVNNVKEINMLDDNPIYRTLSSHCNTNIHAADKNLVNESIVIEDIGYENHNADSKNISHVYNASIENYYELYNDSDNPNLKEQIVDDRKSIMLSKKRLSIEELTESGYEIPVVTDFESIELNSVNNSCFYGSERSLVDEIDDVLRQNRRKEEAEKNLINELRDKVLGSVTVINKLDKDFMETPHCTVKHCNEVAEYSVLDFKSDVEECKQSSFLQQRTSLSHGSNIEIEVTNVESYEDVSSSHYASVGAKSEPYEDVENSYAVIGSECGGDNIYDDVLNVRVTHEDHYESIYSVQRRSPDSDSSCDQSNSLYGLRPPSPQSADYLRPTAARSETSDEWMDLDNSDDQSQEVLVYRERPRLRPNASAAGGWSQKVRRQWSKRVTNESFGGSEPEAGRHAYEKVDGPEDDPAICDDFDDSFDSDSSADIDYSPRQKQITDYGGGEMQPAAGSDGIYGLMKEAGKKMRKHWSLSKSLRRIRNMTVTLPQEPAGAALSRRRWSSFKSKFKQTHSSSTFYLTDESSSPPLPEPRRGRHAKPLAAEVRRYSTPSMRPSSPPPPPPPFKGTPAAADGSVKKPARKDRTTTSWYSECGLFDPSANGDGNDVAKSARPVSGSWYTDAGLWENRSANDSASEHGSSQGSDLHLRFADEPLYQFYAANVAEMARTDLECEYDSDGYEEIGSITSRPSALELITPSHHRSLWCEIPEVCNSGIIETLTLAERRLQEAKFEVISSEASYFKSLTVLEKHFAASPLLADETILNSADRRMLFANVTPVRRCSEKLLAGLEQCWQDSIMLTGICEVISQLAQSNFGTYVKYCSKQIYLDKMLKQLKQRSAPFCQVLAQLEADPKCQSLSLHSFLMLPMQRITRMPLLVDAILTRLDPGHVEYKACQMALAVINKFVGECNEGARREERREELVLLSQQLEWGAGVRPVALLSPARYLVRSGQLAQVRHNNNTFTRRLQARPHTTKLTVFLFNDLLLVARKKSEDSFTVVDHCQRNFVQMSEVDDSLSNPARYLVMFTMLENHDGKTVEMLVSCGSETGRQRWLQAVATPASTNPDETLYEDWDCPQVAALHSYAGSQPDELALQPTDVVNVLRKMADGWYYGERLRDGEKGWFPGNYTSEIASSHIRSKNLKQRYRLLALSGNYLQQQQQLRKSKV